MPAPLSPFQSAKVEFPKFPTFQGCRWEIYHKLATVDRPERPAARENKRAATAYVAALGVNWLRRQLVLGILVIVGAWLAGVTLERSMRYVARRCTTSVG